MVAGGKSPGYFAHDGGISRTLDGYAGLNTGSCAGANQFDSLSQTLGSMTEFVSISADPNDADIILGGAENNGSPKTSTATGSSTFQNVLGGDGGFTAINPANPSPEAREWFAENPYVILKCELGTICNDSSFVPIVDSSNLGADQGAFFTPYILDPQNSGELLVGTCRMWQISTGGTSALQLSNDFDTLGTDVCTGDEINLVNAVAAGGPLVNGGSSVVYAVTNGYGPLGGSPGGEVWVTTGAGVALMANATQNVNPNGYAIATVAMDPSDASGNTAYVGIMGFSTASYPTSHVWKTSNAGGSWTDWTGTGLPDNPVNSLLVDPFAGQIYAGTDVGVFVSSTATASWVEVGPPPGAGVTGFLPDAPVTALQLFEPNPGTKTLVASTYGRGIWNYALVASAAYTNVISNSPQSVFPTQTATFDGTLTSQDGYASPVNLSCTGTTAMPATCTLNPNSIIPTATYTLVAGGDVGDYTFNAHAVGTDSNAITQDAPVTLHVVDFTLTMPNPNTLSAAQGGTSNTNSFQVTALGSFSGVVTLSCPAGLPVGAICAFSPSSSVSPTLSSPVTVTLTVTTSASTPTGGPTSVTISAIASGAPAPKTDVRADGDRAGCELCHRGDSDSIHSGGESDCGVERGGYRGKRIQRKRYPNLRDLGSCDVHYCASHAVAGIERCCFYCDAREQYPGRVQFRNSRNRWDHHQCLASRDADRGRDVNRRGLDQHGPNRQRPRRTERKLYLFRCACGRCILYLGREFCVCGTACIDYRTTRSELHI
jgi:hypothetical protein